MLQTSLYDFHVRGFLTADAAALGDSVMAQLAGNVTEHGVHLLDVENALLFGHYYWDLPASSDGSQAALFFQDGCLHALPAVAAECSTFEHGLMSNGLHGALVEFERRGRVIVSGVQAVNYSASARNATQEKTVLQFLDTLTSQYVGDGLASSASELRQSTNSEMRSYVSWLVGLSVSWSCACCCGESAG